ncbi:MAG: cysteine synthase A [Clostridia bacterium]|nr:cysteine synthase A [Clostridia bacterium]
MLFNSIRDLVGNTPLLELNRIKEHYGFFARVFAKIEAVNPTGSVKDRAAWETFEQAEKSGIINNETVLAEATSGNFGIALASICAVKRIKLVIFMPANMSRERVKILNYFGAQVMLTPPDEGMDGATKRLNEFLRDNTRAVSLKQFENPANTLAHYKGTAQEIWSDLNGKVDIFVAGVGTGGTLSGCAQFFKEKNPLIKIYAVEPESSAVLSGGTRGAHAIQGIGAGFIPPLIKGEKFDGVIKVSDEEAKNAARVLATSEGIFAGISSGAALCAAVKLAKLNENKNIVTVFPDSGEKYLSLL